ncbi:lysophospholipid acyltransferase family protein [Ligilactobacillus aviarius]|uniref:lysophospholipid acyltransferase family protein n=1 Tax=Ligilactobacillus aviarius TaxID=1606 RepID=UPI00388DAD97
MLIFPNRDQVIANIKQNIKDGNFNKKVEVDDPQLSNKERLELISQYFDRRKTLFGKAENVVARTIYRAVTWAENTKTEIVGWENLKGLDPHKGAVITSNHFNPLENTIIRKMTEKLHKRLYIVSQDTNFGMKGLVGFLLNNVDIIPLNTSIEYLGRTFPKLIKQTIDAGNYILIYPEEEMWFNYRKPRPFKRGTYYYAAQAGAPVISCFVELHDLESFEPNAKGQIHRVKATLHILPIIYPDPHKSARENSMWMMEKDYEQKKAAYEAAYGKKLTYDFHPEDIAGWVGSRDKK